MLTAALRAATVRHWRVTTIVVVVIYIRIYYYYVTSHL